MPPERTRSFLQRQLSRAFLVLNVDVLYSTWVRLFDSSQVKLELIQENSSFSASFTVRLGICDSVGLCKSGFKFAFSCPLLEGRAQICTLFHTNLESQIPSLFISKRVKKSDLSQDLTQVSRLMKSILLVLLWPYFGLFWLLSSCYFSPPIDCVSSLYPFITLLHLPRTCSPSIVCLIFIQFPIRVAISLCLQTCLENKLSTELV